MKSIKLILFLAAIVISNLLFAQFTQQGSKLVGTGGANGYEEQGTSVAISSDGNTAVFGGARDTNSAGAVWIFIRNNGVWTQQGPKLVGTGAVGNNVLQGSSVAISSDGNTIIEGGKYDNNFLGAIWVFTRSNGVWTQQGPKLVGTGGVGTSVHGGSVAISSDGNTFIEGAPGDNNNAGAFWVFTRNSGVWSQQGPKLTGTDMIGPQVVFGYAASLSSDGNTSIVGGYGDDSTKGAVWIFTRSSGVWTQQGTKLIGTGAVGNAGQGVSVALSSDGNTFIEGAYLDNNFIGASWVFTRTGGVWTQQGTKLVGTGGSGIGYQGISTAISSDGNISIIGGNFDNSLTGALWVFTRSGGVWTQQGTKLVGTGAVGGAAQGISVAISSDGKTFIEGGTSDNIHIGAIWVFVSPGIGITPISSEIPKDYSLSQNYPNPFNPNSKIKFQITKLNNAKLVVLDILGREVSTLVNEQLKPGTYEVDFDGSKFSSGVYFYKLVAGDFVETKKMILVK